MGKAEELSKAMGGIVGESIGVGRPTGPMFREAAGQGMPDRMKGVVRSKGALDIPVGLIVPDPDQPREVFEPGALERLTESVRRRGVLQPIRVRWVESAGFYMVIMGERRFRAATDAGLASIPCVVMEGDVSQAELLALQLVENLLREDLNEIEEAQAYRELMAANGWTVSQLSRELSIDQGGVSRMLAVLDMPKPVVDLVGRGEIGLTVAYEASKLADPDAQVELAGRIVAEGLNRADVVKEVRSKAKPGKSRGGQAVKKAERKHKASNGYKLKVIAECGRGVDDAGIRAAVAEFLAKLGEDARPLTQAEAAA